MKTNTPIRLTLCLLALALILTSSSAFAPVELPTKNVNYWPQMPDMTIKNLHFVLLASRNYHVTDAGSGNDGNNDIWKTSVTGYYKSKVPWYGVTTLSGDIKNKPYHCTVHIRYHYSSWWPSGGWWTVAIQSQSCSAGIVVSSTDSGYLDIDTNN